MYVYINNIYISQDAQACKLPTKSSTPETMVYVELIPSLQLDVSTCTLGVVVSALFLFFAVSLAGGVFCCGAFRYPLAVE